MMNVYAHNTANDQNEMGNILHLHTVSEPHKSSEVFGVEVADVAKILDYYLIKEQYLNYLLAVISINTARRNKDILDLRWVHFFNPQTGQFRKDMASFVEHKTSKYASPHINQAIKDAIILYLDKIQYDPASDNYEQFVCWQHTGTHKGTKMSYSGCRMALKRAAEKIGIEENVGTHTYRKTFGKWISEMHPDNSNVTNLLQGIYNHSSPQVTLRYMGHTKKMVDTLYDEIGDVFTKYVSTKQEMPKVDHGIVTCIETKDLRQLIELAYQAGMSNANETNASKHIEDINALFDLAESMQKARY